MMSFAQMLLSATLGSLVSSAVVVAVLRIATLHWEKGVEARIADAFRRGVERREVDRARLAELLGPMCGHMIRTEAAMRRYAGRETPVLEVNVMAESNGVMRDLLLTKYHLVPEELREQAEGLLVHFDKWFEIFERERRSGKPESEQARYIYAGPDGFPFPRKAQAAFFSQLHVVSARLAGDSAN